MGPQDDAIFEGPGFLGMLLGEFVVLSLSKRNNRFFVPGVTALELHKKAKQFKKKTKTNTQITNHITLLLAISS